MDDFIGLFERKDSQVYLFRPLLPYSRSSKWGRPRRPHNPKTENIASCNVFSLYTRTASDTDGTLHTDYAGFENIRDIKKFYTIILTT